MARFFRLWGKKRGDRHSGHRRFGEIGEAAFFGALMLLGFLLLIKFLVEQAGSEAPAETMFGLTLGVMALLLICGSVGLVYTLVQMRISTERRSAIAQRATQLPLIRQSSQSQQDHPQVPQDSDLTNIPGIRLAYRLPANESPLWQMGAASTFFLLWITITISLSVAVLAEHEPGKPRWFLLVMLPVCTAVGGWSVFYLWQQLRRYTGIGPTHVEISDHPLHPGHQYALFLSQAGKLEFESFRIALVCQESATYRQGTDTRNSTQCVYHEELLFRESIEVQTGLPFEQECEFQVPQHVMHSFAGTHNSVQWNLTVDVQTQQWPPFRRTFPVVVYPPAPVPREKT